MSPVSSASPRAEASTSAASRRGSLLLVHRLGRREAAAVRRLIETGGEVACLEIDAAQAAEFGNAVRILPAGALPGFEIGAMLPESYDLVELGVEELRRRRPGLVRALARVAASEDVDRYLCRALLREAGSLLGLCLLAAAPEFDGYEQLLVERHWPNGPDFGLLAEVVHERGLALRPSLATGLGRLAFEAAPAARLRTVAHVWRQLLGLWRESLRLGRPASAAETRPLLLRSYEWDWGIDRDGQRRLRNLDFVVDGETISPADVGVWLDDGAAERNRDELLRRGYATVSRSGFSVGAPRFTIGVLPALVAWSTVFLRLTTAERWWAEPVRRLLAELLLWREVARRTRPRIFLTLNDLRPTGVARAFALRRAGCRTVEYEFSSHWLTDERGWVPDYVYGFSVVDAMVTWGPLHSDHLRNHRAAIREFWEVGCLWSEHARLVRDDPGIRRSYQVALEEEVGRPLADFQHVVGVFDTSTASFFGNDDMVAFYAGVTALAQRLPRVLFLCKPKRPVQDLFAGGAGGADVAAALEAAPNVTVLGEWFETAAVVGLSDLSVNACFTSPAVETIGLGRPALYYDPTQLFPHSFFRDVPHLVATGEDELAALVEAQLALTGEELERDLRSRFEALEGHFDGLAITRLRERLRAELDRPQP